MNIEKSIKLGRVTALITFLLGTGIFGLYFLTASNKFLYIGNFYLIFFGLFNLMVLISLSLKTTKEKETNTKLLRTCGILLLNIPVILTYCWFTIILLNTMRISFSNTTDSELKHIKIIGCNGGYINKLDVGESKTIWIDINHDCSIKISYWLKGHQKKEIVVGYITPGFGSKLQFNIGILK